jgi:hypothetical protein
MAWHSPARLESLSALKTRFVLLAPSDESLLESSTISLALSPSDSPPMIEGLGEFTNSNPRILERNVEVKKALNSYLT